MNDQTAIIYNLLGKLEEKYLSEEIILRAILEGDIAKQMQIEFVDALCQTVVTSLNFGDNKRAAKYLTLAAVFCKPD